MARTIAEKSQATNPANPSILGEDIVNLFVEGFGVASTAVVGDRIVGPLVHQVIPGTADENGMVGKVVDAGAAFGTAWLLGEGVGMVHKRYGNLIKRGGVLLGVAKLAGAVVPGYTLSSLPTQVSGWIPSPFTQAPKQVTGATGQPVSAVAAMRQVGRSGL